MPSEDWYVKTEKFENRESELAGVIDMHIHIGPDSRPRIMDSVDLAIEARNARMKAIVIKPMSSALPSTDKAYFAEKAVSSIRVFGGLILPPVITGLNIRAVEDGIAMGAKSVWMPVTEAVLHLDPEARKRCPLYFDKGYATPKSKEEAMIPVKSGKAVPEMQKIFNVIAEHKDVIFGTSHVSPEDALVLIDAAKSAGVEKITVTHPNSPLINTSMDQMKEEAKKGAYLELNFIYTYGFYGGQSPAFLASIMKTVGPQHCTMVTDSGQTMVPPPVEVMRNYIRAMKLCGISSADIDVMTKKNPAYLLGI